MKEKRRDSKGRILPTGESQRTDGKYLYKYVDAFGNTKYVYAWILTPTDPTPKGKREKMCIRDSGISFSSARCLVLNLHKAILLKRSHLVSPNAVSYTHLLRLLN